MPPSPWLSAVMTYQRYLTLTTRTSDQNMSERTPRTPAVRSTAGRWPMHSRMVYRGLVPMSPKTTPRAPRHRIALARGVE